MKNAVFAMLFVFAGAARAVVPSETLVLYMDVVVPTLVEQSLLSAKIETVTEPSLKAESWALDKHGIEAKYLFQERSASCTLNIRTSAPMLTINGLYADLNCLLDGKRTHGTFLKSSDTVVREAILTKLDALANLRDARPNGAKSKCTLHPKTKLDDELTARSLVNDTNPLIQEIRRAKGLEVRTLEVSSWQECFREAHKIVREWKKAAPGACANGTAVKQSLLTSRSVNHSIYLEWQLDDGILNIPYTNTYGYINCHTDSEPKQGDQIVYR